MSRWDLYFFVYCFFVSVVVPNTLGLGIGAILRESKGLSKCKIIKKNRISSVHYSSLEGTIATYTNILLAQQNVSVKS